jgi:hypothetical protein
MFDLGIVNYEHIKSELQKNIVQLELKRLAAIETIKKAVQ